MPATGACNGSVVPMGDITHFCDTDPGPYPTLRLRCSRSDHSLQSIPGLTATNVVSYIFMSIQHPAYGDFK